MAIFNALAVQCLDHARYALPVIQFASISAELELVKVVRQMLTADTVKCAHDAALNQ